MPKQPQLQALASLVTVKVCGTTAPSRDNKRCQFQGMKATPAESPARCRATHMRHKVAL